ncbi:MAG: hypothetical protein MI824_07805 [Hyphomicrobiales bacterium]|nr:hypothetical protein [Hyphomicrobiales bacterium]
MRNVRSGLWVSAGRVRSRLIAAAVLLAAAAAVPPHASAERLLDFDMLQGKWTGFGWFVFAQADKQRARCQAIIKAEGDPSRGSMDLTCASDEMDIAGTAFDIVLNGSKASGKWKLLTHHADGTLDGTITENSLSAFLTPQQGGDGSAGAQLSTIIEDKCRASIKLSVRSPIDLKKIDLSVRRC